MSPCLPVHNYRYFFFLSDLMPQSIIVSVSLLNLNIESRVFNRGENEFVDKNWNPGTSSDIVDSKNKKIVIVVVDKLLAPTPKSYTDSKGLVTADYQTYLEKEWINTLKKKYAVSIDKTVLATIK